VSLGWLTLLFQRQNASADRHRQLACWLLAQRAEGKAQLSGMSRISVCM
jgi:hypothetical protein